MTFENLMERIADLGISKSGLEKRCGFYKGKLTEASKGRVSINNEIIVGIISALEELSEEIALLAEEAQTLDARNIMDINSKKLVKPLKNLVGTILKRKLLQKI